MLKDRWFLYTLVVGLIPTGCRLALTFLIKSAPVSFALNETDFISLGLAFNLANINEIEGKDFLDKRWVLWRRGVSFMLLFGLALMLTTSMIQEVISQNSPKVDFFDTRVLKALSFLLSISSLFYGYSTFAYIQKARPNDE
jgi:hypothetical protein